MSPIAIPGYILLYPSLTSTRPASVLESSKDLRRTRRRRHLRCRKIESFEMFLHQRYCQRCISLLHLTWDSQLYPFDSRVNRNNTEFSLRSIVIGKSYTSLSAARCLKISRAPDGCSTVNAATLFLKIPPLCQAILSNVSPSTVT